MGNTRKYNIPGLGEYGVSFHGPASYVVLNHGAKPGFYATEGAANIAGPFENADETEQGLKKTLFDRNTKECRDITNRIEELSKTREIIRSDFFKFRTD